MLIHVGLHKCASTWLQSQLFDYPQRGFHSPWGRLPGHAVTEFVTVDPLLFDPSNARRRLEEAARPAPVASVVTVLSHEALSSRPHHGQLYAPIVAERLRDTFPEAKLLMIFREQRALIRSLYVEHVRNGGRTTLDEFMGRGDEPPGFQPMCRLSFFEFDRLVTMYEDVFGAGRVLALPMEMLSHDADAFLRSICDFAGVGVPEVPASTKLNVGWGPLTTEFARRLNGLLRKSTLRPGHDLTSRAKRRMLNAVDTRLLSGLQNRYKERQRAHIARRIDGHYAESNRRLSGKLSLDLGSFGYQV